MGTHDELMDKQGIYYRLVMNQVKDIKKKVWSILSYDYSNANGSWNLFAIFVALHWMSDTQISEQNTKLSQAYSSAYFNTMYTW